MNTIKLIMCLVATQFVVGIKAAEKTDAAAKNMIKYVYVLSNGKPGCSLPKVKLTEQPGYIVPPLTVVVRDPQNLKLYSYSLDGIQRSPKAAEETGKFISYRP